MDASRAVASHLPSSVASNVGAAMAGSAGRPQGPEPIRRCLSMIMFVRANFGQLSGKFGNEEGHRREVYRCIVCMHIQLREHVLTLWCACFWEARTREILFAVGIR